MSIPGTGIPGAAENPEIWSQAEEESEKLLAKLKEAVQADTRDIGVLRKELRITVPEKVIADHLEHNYSELMHEALVPGFRKGHAPRQLIQKRFGAEVRDSITTAIIAQAYFAAVEREKLETLGDPLFRVAEGESVKLMGFDEALQHLKLPETGDFSYTCECELKPVFTLPELKNIPIRTPKIEITDAMVDEQILQRRKVRGRLEPVAGAAERDDQVIADVVLTVGGSEVKREANVSFGVRPTRLDGVLLPKLDETLVGVQAGETRAADCTIPDDYERADVRGQAGKFEFHVHEIKRLVPMTVAEYVEAYSYDSEQDLRDDVRNELGDAHDRMVEQQKKGQVEQYLLDRTTLELPQDFSARQTDRAVARRIVDLQMQGMPITDIEANIDTLRTSARESVARELKLGFILEKVAEELGVTVTDEEVNTEIAQIAARYNRRFDRVRDDLHGRGLLDQLVEQIRHDKCVTRLLADASVAADETPTA